MITLPSIFIDTDCFTVENYPIQEINFYLEIPFINSFKMKYPNIKVFMGGKNEIPKNEFFIYIPYYGFETGFLTPENENYIMFLKYLETLDKRQRQKMIMVCRDLSTIVKIFESLGENNHPVFAPIGICTQKGGDIGSICSNINYFKNPDIKNISCSEIEGLRINLQIISSTNKISIYEFIVECILYLTIKNSSNYIVQEM